MEAIVVNYCSQCGGTPKLRPDNHRPEFPDGAILHDLSCPDHPLITALAETNSCLAAVEHSLELIARSIPLGERGQS